MIPLFFTTGLNPFELVKWEKRDVKIERDGEILFSEIGVEVPTYFADVSVEVIAQKYFSHAEGKKETSVRQMYDRVVSEVVRWTVEDKYLSQEEGEIFRNELRYLLVNQMMCFNSPVWFNVGVKEKPQTSACYILSAEDTMESILKNAVIEGMIFKQGSGCGSNRSALRGSKEKISSGGFASGPVIFMKIYNEVADVVRSGGITRRAAKMEILNIDHPDIEEFINAKVEQELRAKSFISSGVNSKKAYEMVGLQNLNQAVRVTDEFMKAVENEGLWELTARKGGQTMKTVSARSLFKSIAKAAWECGDPGMQFHTEINRWNTLAEDGEIVASNPCSELFTLNDCACELVSLNLMKFRTENGDFNTEAFIHAVKVVTLAKEVMIDRSHYPTEQITKNSQKYRPIGVGYTNLGALLMSLGLPYDSNEGRSLASAITSLMTASAYKMSAEIAEKKGAFEAYKKNSAKMKKVLKQHRVAVVEDKPSSPLAEKILNLSRQMWDEVIEVSKQENSAGFRNSQVTLLAPTGTISWAMGCDTFGVEPEFQLVKQKDMREGGFITTTNSVVPIALRFLGYSQSQVEMIVDYVKEKGFMDGASFIKPEHLSVFDCATGRRPLGWPAHLKMLAAIQPFLSGGISKTVNLPANVTVEDIEQVFMESWKMGLKSVIIYRYGSKGYQPLTGKDKEEERNSTQLKWGERKRLPGTFDNAIRHKFEIGGVSGYLHVGPYPDGPVAEMFVDIQKQGDLISGLSDFGMINLSFALQYGAKLKDLVRKHMNTKYAPAGKVTEDDHPRFKKVGYATSLGDFIARWLGLNFLSEEDQEELGLIEAKKHGLDSGMKVVRIVNHTKEIPIVEAEVCLDCHVTMSPAGTCWVCPICKKSGGCLS